MKKVFIIFFILVAGLIFPDTAMEEEGFDAVEFIIDLFVLFFSVFLFSKVEEWIHIPRALGYIIAGIILSPHLLGNVGVPWIAPQGLFPLADAKSIPVRPEIFAMSYIGIILLLFKSGLETEMSVLFRYAGKGFVVAVSAVIVSFVLGDLVAMYYLGEPFSSIKCLFLGAIATATSVGLTANILSEKRKMQSPEGITIIAAAVIDDIIGIVVLGVILGMANAINQGSTLDVKAVAIIGIRATVIWFIFTFVGVVFSRFFGKGLKKMFKDRTILVIMAIGSAMLIGGIFEKFGLSAAIGAYIVGLSLSNTDLAFLIQDKMKVHVEMFVPIFFVISGMYIDLSAILKPEAISFALVYAVVGVFAKVIGAGGISMLLGFNMLGAIRIGIGMVPRAEIAILMASMGLNDRVIGSNEMSATLTLVLLASIVTPIVLDMVLNDKNGETRENKNENDEEVIHELDLITSDFAELVCDSLIDELEKEDFFISRIENTYHIRKEDIFMTLTVEIGKLVFVMNKRDLEVFNMAMRESFAQLFSVTEQMQQRFSKNVDFSIKERQNKDVPSALKLVKYTTQKMIILDLKGTNKEEIIKEMLEVMHNYGNVKDRAYALEDVLSREEEMSTGMTDNIAIPHAKTPQCDDIQFALGIKKEGVDWDCLDGEPAKIIVLIMSPENKGSPYILLLSSISAFLNNPETREKLLACDKVDEVYTLLDATSHRNTPMF